MDLENQALGVLLCAGAREESSTGSMLENLPDTLVRLSRALEILVGTNLLADVLTLALRVSRLVHRIIRGRRDELISSLWKALELWARMAWQQLTSSGETGF